MTPATWYQLGKCIIAFALLCTYFTDDPSKMHGMALAANAGFRGKP